MKRPLFCLLISLFFLALSAQERRPIDNRNPLWLVHIDVWNSADPQKIIDLIPDDIKPYVCMNLSLSCQYDKNTNMYRMPRYAVRTYKSWASVCQQNGMWFTCQPASGGHTHIQDDDLETFEYFFKTYPNFLGWNYAEQFWGFDEAGDKSSSTQQSRIALFAKLVEMSHRYGGFLTVSFCGNIWSHPLNPLGMMKRNPDLYKACKEHPEAILWLYKYTTSSCFYNNESVTWGPFVAGLANNYGVRYDNCGWNGALGDLFGDNNGKPYPGAAGIGTVMEQTCVNGGAVWDGPELIWTEDFQNLNNSTVDGYTRRNWGRFPNFDGIWLDMFGKIIDGSMYIPSRMEVVGKTKIAVINDVQSGSDEDKYAAWGDLYDGLYKQSDPFNKNNGTWMDNLCYFKKSGRYGTIPVMLEPADESAMQIPVQVDKSKRSSRWSSTSKKVAEFNKQYPEISQGDLYVNRFRNQLVTYTPYSNINGKKSASARIPLEYNTCDTLELTYDVLSAGVIREYEDHIDFYLNNFRNDTTTMRKDVIRLEGLAAEPKYRLKNHGGFYAKVEPNYNQDKKSYQLDVTHLGPLDISVFCKGEADRAEAKDAIPSESALKVPKQPEALVCPIIIEAENMDYRNVKNVAFTHSGWWAQDYSEFAGLGYVEMGSDKQASLRHQLRLMEAGDYDVIIRYCNTSSAGDMEVSVNGTVSNVKLDKVKKNEWKKIKVPASLNAGGNTLILTNTGAAAPTIDQIIYMPKGTPEEKYLVTVRECERGGKVSADVREASEGQKVTLTVNPEDGYALKELKIVNSVFYSMSATIEINDGGDISFTMPDDNVTIQPVFVDTSSIYKLDFTDVANGTIPEGWRCVQENDEIHQYPETYGMGARTFKDFKGYQGKALYWRNDRAEYGAQSNYRLNLEPGDYRLTFAMAAWKEKPSYKVVVRSVDSNSIVAESEVFTTTANANGNTSADLSSEPEHEFEFSLPDAGNYIIQFVDQTNGGGYHEFLLLECKLNKTGDSGVEGINETQNRIPAGIYTPSGLKISSMQSGLNIVIEADGTVRKVMVR
ncbi:MAG: glycosyl hydrolase family 98 [Muribaculaceae bacterium]|nr:glycosyl hydrolase family 98 [Muribaculaceae bacterium]